MCRDKKTATATLKSHDYNPDIRRLCWIARLCGLALDALVAAYPDYLLSHDNASIVWKDGTAKRRSLAPRSL